MQEHGIWTTKANAEKKYLLTFYTGSDTIQSLYSFAFFSSS